MSVSNIASAWCELRRFLMYNNIHLHPKTTTQMLATAMTTFVVRIDGFPEDCGPDDDVDDGVGSVVACDAEVKDNV